MKILVAYERSGVVRRAFALRGHDVWSCDLEAADDASPNHLRCDARPVMSQPDTWDMIIAHPPCTYLSVSGMHWTTRGLRDRKLTEAALEDFRLCLDAPAPRVCVENPVGIVSTMIRRPDQYVQPYNFGHDASKKTGLWLRGLPKLRTTGWVPPRVVCAFCKAPQVSGTEACVECGNFRFANRWGNQTDSGHSRLGPSEDRAKIRAETYAGIAQAMAMQWG